MKSRLTKICALVLAMVPLTACADKHVGVASAKTDASPAQSTARLPALSKDMAYADLRRKITAYGWHPVPDPQCRANVGGTGAICDQMAELESCSGDGYCVMHFGRNAEKLAVYTYGIAEDWNIVGEQSRLRVTEWEFGR